MKSIPQMRTNMLPAPKVIIVYEGCLPKDTNWGIKATNTYISFKKMFIKGGGVCF